MARALELAHRVGRNMGYDVCRRLRDLTRHELGDEGCEPEEPSLLPPAYDGDGRTVVGERGRGRGEGETPPRTLAAALDWPRCRRSTAQALRWAESTKRCPTGRAQVGGRAMTGDAATRQQEIDEPRRSRYAGKRHVSVTSSQQECDVYSGE
jgi:hypothetical protein